MGKSVLIFDTSILCAWLRVPGKETCGSGSDTWTHAKADAEIRRELQNGATLVLPLATIIETGNHISQSPGDRFGAARKLAKVMARSADQTSPWAAFQNESALWDADGLKSLAETWPDLAKAGLSIGDATIKRIADYYAQAGNRVSILTADNQLKAYQPPAPTIIPRRRK